MGMRRVMRLIPPIARRDDRIRTLEDERLRLRRQRDRERTTTAQLAADLSAAQRERDAARAHGAELEAQLKAELERVNARLAERTNGGRVSLFEKFNEAHRIRQRMALYGAREPARAVNSKVAGYEFARGHGLDVPAVLASYSAFREIDWSGLPDGFVIKTVEGSTSRGVVPVERVGDRYLDLLDSRSAPRTAADIVADLEAKRDHGLVSDRVIIEELLRSPYGDDRTIAPDLKLYCFYGEIGMIMIRDCRGSRDPRDFSFRFLDGKGGDLGAAMTGRPVDPTLRDPLHLDDLRDAGRRLSAAMSVPFVRLDFYERAHGVVFGETTLAPGGRHLLRSDVDTMLVGLWEDAEARLRRDLIAADALSLRIGRSKSP